MRASRLFRLAHFGRAASLQMRAIYGTAAVIDATAGHAPLTRHSFHCTPHYVTTLYTPYIARYFVLARFLSGARHYFSCLLTYLPWSREHKSSERYLSKLSLALGQHIGASRLSHISKRIIMHATLPLYDRYITILTYWPRRSQLQASSRRFLAQLGA